MRCGVAANLLSFDHHFKRITSRWRVRIWQTFQVDLTCGAVYPETGSVTRLTTYDTIGDASIVAIIGPLGHFDIENCLPVLGGANVDGLRRT